MLVLTRRAGQALRIGANVEVTVVRVEGDRVVLGIVAPRHVAVVRAELLEEVVGEVKDAAETRARLRVMLGARDVARGSGPAPRGDDPATA